jgi:DNA-binding NarL/FixJ family response regulator
MVTVYLCDDTDELRRVLRRALGEDPGIEVVGDSGDPIEAIEEIAELQPQVVLLDLSMPRIDGLEALPLIKRVAPEVSVIVFSGFTAARMAGLALASGADRYVQKGEQLQELREMVREMAA